MAQEENNKGPTEGQEQEEAPRVDTSDLRVTDANGDPIEAPTEEETGGEQEGQTNGLPEGFESIEQLIDAYKDLKGQGQGDGGDDATSAKDEETQDQDETDEDRDDQDDQDDDDSESQSQYEARIRDLELKLHDKEIQELVGGADKYDEIQQWASNALEEGEAETFNKVFDSSDLQAKKVAAKALQAMYREANGFEGERVNGGTPSGITPIKSDGELMEAMQDPRYRRKDSVGEAYRAEIDKRLAAGQSKGKQMNADGWMSFSG